MPRLTQAVPKYRKHRASGQAIVTISGQDHYLGPHRPGPQHLRRLLRHRRLDRLPDAGGHPSLDLARCAAGTIRRAATAVERCPNTPGDRPNLRDGVRRHLVHQLRSRQPRCLRIPIRPGLVARDRETGPMRGVGRESGVGAARLGYSICIRLTINWK